MELTREQIKEGNEAIAKFLGWFEQEVSISGTWWETSGYANYIAYSILNNYPHKDLPFHRDWNYLMKVVDKIGTIVYHREGDAPDYDWKKHYSLGELFHHMWNHWLRVEQAKKGEINLMNSIESIWSAVVEYINWYNNENKDKLFENCKHFDERQGRNLCCNDKLLHSRKCKGICENFTEK